MGEQAGTVSTEIELVATESGIVTGDPDRLLQVVLNLLQNAINAVAAHPTRNVRVAIQSFGSSVLLAVEDSSPGVVAAQRKTIFKPFYNYTTKREGTGRGLGLNISRSIAEEHGGVLEFSAESGGAIFTLTLPRASVPRASVPRGGAATA